MILWFYEMGAKKFQFHFLLIFRVHLPQEAASMVDR